MRQLTLSELFFVSGAETNTHIIFDPVAAVSAYFHAISVTDRQGFMQCTVVSGMTTGAVAGSLYAISAFALSSGALIGGAATIAGAGAGTIVGGIAAKCVAKFAVGTYSMLMD